MELLADNIEISTAELSPAILHIIIINYLQLSVILISEDYNHIYLIINILYEAEYLAIARFQPRPAELMSYGHVFLFLIDCYYIYLSLMHICDLCQTF